MTSKDSRLDKIKSDLAAIKRADNTTQKRQNDKQDDSESMNVGLRAGAELITAIFAGGLIGYGLDQWLGTKPFFLIAMLVLGVITGFVNVWRTTQNLGYQVGYRDSQRTNKNDNDQ